MLIRDFLYSLLLLISWPFWLARALKRLQRASLKGRLRPQLAASAEKTIWIHAVSVGEVRSLKSLIGALRQKGCPVVISVTTPAGLACARCAHPDMPVIPAPFDFSFAIRRFIDRVNPRLVVFNELEIWPNWIALLRRRRIPMLLINGRISEAAFRRYRAFAFILRPFFRSIDCYLVQNELYKERFLRLGIPAERITVCGNIKADEAEGGRDDLPEAAAVFTSLGLAPRGRRIAVLASSHEEDESVFIPAIPGQAKDYFFVIVPRHVERAGAIAARLRQEGVNSVLFSREKIGVATQALVYDRMGFLFQIISIADIVFMGGTFNAATGGHNLYEPAALGKTIVGGPCCGNFPDIGRELEERGAYHRLADWREWREFLTAFPNLDRQLIGEHARAAVAAKKGSLACSLEHIERYLA